LANPASRFSVINPSPSQPFSGTSSEPYQPQRLQRVERAGRGFPDERDFLAMRVGAIPVSTNPVSKLPRGYQYDSSASPKLEAHLNDDEAMVMFVYERWRETWWYLNPPFGSFAWQLPFDPMANPWVCYS
jgi:hypothetical protein